MNVGKKDLIWTPGKEENDQKEIYNSVQSKSKINRLRRSPKASPAETKSQSKSDYSNSTSETGFKTPTRAPQARFRTSFTVESPNNESEFQHDIIWDPTSPVTPIRNGRGRRKTAHFRLVDISDIVSRIAPQNRRPEEAESSLLQWIGDTAVPCTPEVREPKTKPKSTRQNNVANLLKLAKQFDFNMIHQVEPRPLSSKETMDEDQELFFDENYPPALPHVNSVTAAATKGLEESKVNSDDSMDTYPVPYPAFDLGMQEDLDLLFDDALSQGLSACAEDVAQIGLKVTDLVGVGINLTAGITDSRSRVTQLSQAKGTGTTAVRIAAQKVTEVCSTEDFDDWNNNDLLEDSLVMEVTQNPELFSAPQQSSAQKMNKISPNIGCSLMHNTNSTTNSAYHQPDSGAVKYGTTQRKNLYFQGRQSFHQWNKPTGNGNNIQSPVPEKSNQPGKVLPSGKVLSAVPVSFLSNPKQISTFEGTYQPKERGKMQKSLETISGCNTWTVQKTSMVSNSCSARSVSPSFQRDKDIRFTDEKENHPALGDNITSEDLDFIFASEDIWNEGEDDDDDLFCEACEEVEEFLTEPDAPKESVLKPTPGNDRTVQNKTLVSSTGANTAANINMPIHDSRYAPRNRSSLSPQKHVLSEAAPNSFRCTTGGKTVKDGMMKSFCLSSEGCYKFTEVQSSSAVSSARPPQQLNDRGSATFHQSASRIGDHQFRKPFSTFINAPSTNKDISKAVMSKCSDAEIERKKQQAVERRRVRMLATQNLQATT